MKKDKNVRTKVKKSERVELRCTKAFKESLQEIAVHNDLTISALIESICTDKIKEYFSDNSKEITQKKPAQKSAVDAQPKRTERKDYEKEIWRMMQDGETPTKTAEWLNENGFKPQRGEKFTLNSVHSIRRRLKREK
ncbi:hypothetical protein R7041_22145 [Vibrio sp. 1751]|nr:MULTISPECIES: recombinase family protein [Vibrio]MDF5474131.1 hypothetical protein [Vibrio parahaemolyticus]MDF5601733.1 hypothetical protein [Vibrio parahaemolyticus]MDW2100041.1 hypothetical protein [Vibrio sp. 1751]MDW2244559.1 hypothetical protein [Vibrio sp. 1287]TMX38232.1 hypothetical protein DA095_11190 [Vibrio rotiferianus]